jgi:hypothetical protein
MGKEAQIVGLFFIETQGDWTSGSTRVRISIKPDGRQALVIIKNRLRRADFGWFG